ncbi:hypothetical protein SZN_12163 [Streptomyces zinciresistens K42]|uniref:Uncharacterized protein n=1 Tax=Streptomyces zinciresistens K42 TaxID=700597 RepID=G2GAB0_9ACTN|nr:hypothetical protein SZN_12163 [Streptomyces zinciresistens K42]
MPALAYWSTFTIRSVVSEPGPGEAGSSVFHRSWRTL